MELLDPNDPCDSMFMALFPADPCVWCVSVKGLLYSSLLLGPNQGCPKRMRIGRAIRIFHRCWPPSADGNRGEPGRVIMAYLSHVTTSVSGNKILRNIYWSMPFARLYERNLYNQKILSDFHEIRKTKIN